MKHKIMFPYYPWIALLFGGLLSIIAFCFGGEDRVGLIASVMVGAIGFCYFMQQQKLAETMLFHKLFTEFNRRYDEKNEVLLSIKNKKAELLESERNEIVDYFNLCSEEFLFFKQGYIHDDVWTSWCRGILWYLESPVFQHVWSEEVKTKSHYGLTLALIQKGAQEA